MSIVQYENRNGIAVIAMNNPPVNSLGYALRVGLMESIDQAMDDAMVRAVVLTGLPKAFCGGADISEFAAGTFSLAPRLFDVITTLDNSPKPVVAAISGACMGGGLELALACHYRVTLADAQIALPEVHLGIIPGAGGTQRLPRVLGLEPSLNAIVSGATQPAETFHGTPLFDEIVTSDVVTAAVAFAGRIADVRPLKRVRDMKVEHPNADGFLDFARQQVKAAFPRFPAREKCIDALHAAVHMPFDQGIDYETELCETLMRTSESKALRHVFFGERATSKIPDVPPDTPVRPVARVAVIGAGTMGGGIAMCFLNAGLPVVLLEMKQEALERGIATIRKNYENSARKGKLSTEKLEQRMGLLQGSLSYDDLKSVDLVVEAVFEDLGVKEQVFRKLDEVAKPGAILASNTSTLDLNKIAACTRRPEDVIGMHFFSPANVMRLLEVVRGARTGKDVLATVMGLAKKIRKLAVVSGVCDGFIGNRMVHQYMREACFLLEEGALPWQVDRALEKWGMAMGVFRMNDLAGNDVSRLVRQRQYVEYPDMKFSGIADKLCDLGRYGQKTGAGWYRYEEGKRDPQPDPVVETLIVNHSQEMGISRRKISDQEIVQRLIFALVNEGAKLLEEGIALRASDIDMVYLAGYGFPSHRGGPMLYADNQGLYNVLRAIKRFGRGTPAPDLWAPAPLLVRHVAERKNFN